MVYVCIFENSQFFFVDVRPTAKSAKISRYTVFSMLPPRMCTNEENVFHEICENFVLQKYWCMYMSPISCQDV